MAKPIRPLERLPMKRTGSMGSAVPPALTTMCQPARSAERVAPVRGGRADGSGSRTGRPAIAPATASTRSGRATRRPTPTWPEASGPEAGSTTV